MTFHSARFGSIEFESTDVVAFEQGLLGFPNCRSFLILEHRPGSPFRWLQSLEEAELAFLVIDPSHLVLNYAPEISDAEAQSLQLSEDSLRFVYTIVTIPPGRPEAMTLNLAAPLLINAETRQARQIVLEGDLYPIRFPVPLGGADEQKIAA